MNRSVLTVLVAAALAAAVPLAAQGTDREADHQQLRAMLATLRDAVNQKQVEKVEPLLAPGFSMIFADGQVITDAATLKRYFQDLTAADTGVITSLTVNPTADELTRFLAPDVGVCHGHSSDTFVLRGGLTRVLDSRWTATVVKQDGTWKLAAFQIGANVLDNVILQEHRRFARGVGIGGGALALVTAGLGFLLGRRSSRS
jgi:ketosteroid isomerase-like protein